MVFEGAAREVDVFARVGLAPGDELKGPAIILEEGATTVIEPGWSGSVDSFGHLILARAEPPVRAFAAGTRNTAATTFQHAD